MTRRFLIRLWAVIRKEIVELLRQNRLILTLVIGPFLILSLFGLGFRNESPTKHVILLDPFQTGLQDEVEEFIPNLGDAVNLVATTTDTAQAEQLLKNQTVDLIIIPPPDAIGSIRNSEHAEITILHSEDRPVRAGHRVGFRPAGSRPDQSGDLDPGRGAKPDGSDPGQ